MRLRQALRIVMTSEDKNKQQFIYPKNVSEIEKRISILKRNADRKIEQKKISASNRLMERRQLWQGILEKDMQNKIAFTKDV